MKTSITTRVLSSAASYNLTLLATVKDELSLKSADTSNDVWITRAIGQASTAVMNYTNRVFAPEMVQDYLTIERSRSQVPGGQWLLQLSRWPVLAIASLVQASSMLGTTTTLVEGTDFRVDYDTGELYRTDSSTGMDTAWEALPVTVKYVAGFGAIVAESHVVPATPYQVIVAQSAVFSCDQSITYASNGVALVAVAANPAIGQYSLNQATGTYTFAAADTGKTLNFAYATLNVPDDVEDACLRLLTGRYHGKGRDPTLMESDMPMQGRQRWWISTSSGQKSGLPPEIASMLDNYHVPVIA